MIDQTEITLAGPSIDQVASQFEKYGVVIIPDYLDAAATAALMEEFHDFTTTPDTNYKVNTPYSDGLATRVKGPKLDANRFPQTRAVFSSEFMQAVAERCWSKTTELNSEIFIVKDVVGSEHVANDLHYDVKPTLKFLIYLTDTTAENGAFTCVPGSHLKTKELRERYGKKVTHMDQAMTRDLPVEEGDEIPIEGKAGTLVIFSTDVFHKAGKVSSGERYVMRGHSRTAEQGAIGILDSLVYSIKQRLRRVV